MNALPAAPASSRLAWWMVPVCAVLLALRKPWALHTPQLWAEDGTIFLTQDELLGGRALLEPYNGYLHMLPRLIAWIAARVADPAWWPAIYNGLTYAISIGLCARLASRRIDLPAKPWLMLAPVLVVGSGEVLLNATNVQWLASFYLLLQVFATRPPGALQRVADLALLAVVGLNGPFALVLLPLFAWRAWRDRNADTASWLAVVGLCAAVQAWFLTRTTLHLESSHAAFQPFMFLAVLGSRLITWSFAGPRAVETLPNWAHALGAVAILGSLLAWACRPSPRRAVRLQLVAVFCFITLASVYRVRADTWPADNMSNGDRYFYIPRVLFAWLLILEFDTVPRAIAWVARGLCVVAVASHVPYFVLPAPPDYKWAEHCDPIRRGVPANIPTLPEGWVLEYVGRPHPR